MVIKYGMKYKISSHQVKIHSVITLERVGGKIPTPQTQCTCPGYWGHMQSRMMEKTLKPTIVRFMVGLDQFQIWKKRK